MLGGKESARNEHPHRTLAAPVHRNAVRSPRLARPRRPAVVHPGAGRARHATCAKRLRHARRLRVDGRQRALCGGAGVPCPARARRQPDQGHAGAAADLQRRLRRLACGRESDWLAAHRLQRAARRPEAGLPALVCLLPRSHEGDEGQRDAHLPHAEDPRRQDSAGVAGHLVLLCERLLHHGLQQRHMAAVRQRGRPHPSDQLLQLGAQRSRPWRHTAARRLRAGGPVSDADRRQQPLGPPAGNDATARGELPPLLPADVHRWRLELGRPQRRARQPQHVAARRDSLHAAPPVRT